MIWKYEIDNINNVQQIVAEFRGVLVNSGVLPKSEGYTYQQAQNHLHQIYFFRPCRKIHFQNLLSNHLFHSYVESPGHPQHRLYQLLVARYLGRAFGLNRIYSATQC